MDVTIIGGAAAHLNADLRTPRIFESEDLPASGEVLARLRRGIDDVDLAANPVVLPDFHHKRKLEMPSSIAVATRGTIRPTLTSGSVNCGMALIALDTGLAEGEKPDTRSITRFFEDLKLRYPYPTGARRDLTYKECLRVAAEGADFAMERWGVHAEDIERIEEQGRIDLDRYGGIRAMRKVVPSLAFQLARLRFGTVGPSNHFVELQRVEEVYDAQKAAGLGVKQGQIVINFHAGGGVLTGEVGRMFGRRKDFPKHLRYAEAVLKPWSHLRTGNPAVLRERWRLYFAGECPPVDIDSAEGRRLLLANAAAMNYGFAFRMATYGALRELAVRAFGGAPGRLVVDSPHNSVYEEDVNGEPAVVHRHNSCRAFGADRMRPGTVFAQTGQAVLIPGTHRTSSYLAVAGENAAESLHSACHGAGTVVKQFAEDGRSTEQHSETLRFRYSTSQSEVVKHYDDNGVAAALGILATHKLVAPVARMRPFAVLH
ncbi:MAG: RNA-splicing ligase RtcB [Catenulispora sp.]|nr:RNA-splicing ligase RtcB [Catenulispora sp.]